MQEPHIRSAYDRDLENVQAHIAHMGELVDEAIGKSIEALANRDERLAEKVRRNDNEVDDIEEKIHAEASRIIALRAPTAIDLRLILTVIKISVNLERIGDLSKNIAKRTGVLVQLSPVSGATSAVKRMGREIRLMLKDALAAYIDRDEGKAHDVIQRDEDIDQMYNALFRQLLTFMMEDARNITACMHLHFIAKNLERMGDHVTTIAEHTVFLTSGTAPNDRVKLDFTAAAAINGMTSDDGTRDGKPSA